MAKATPNDDTAGNTAVPHDGDHDRVQMLSLRADGTPDQHNPEIIGDKDVAVAAAKEQFAQQAAAAAETPEGAEKAADAAKTRAEKVVNELHKG